MDYTWHLIGLVRASTASPLAAACKVTCAHMTDERESNDAGEVAEAEQLGLALAKRCQANHNHVVTQ